MLGIFPDHLDYHRTESEYLNAKRRLAAFQERRDTILYNSDCKSATTLAKPSAGSKIGFSFRFGERGNRGVSAPYRPVQQL